MHDRAAEVAAICKPVADHFGVLPTEIASPSLRRRVLDARAVVCHVAVCCRGLSLSAVGRCLGLSKQSVARALQRATPIVAANADAIESLVR